MKSKKTAYELACDYIIKLDTSLSISDGGAGPMYCEGYTKNKCCKIKNYKNCFECAKQYFQQQADIPDGWDVVKEIHKEFLERFRNRTKTREDLLSERAEQLTEDLLLVEGKLKEAGIEVE